MGWACSWPGEADTVLLVKGEGAWAGSEEVAACVASRGTGDKKRDKHSLCQDGLFLAVFSLVTVLAAWGLGRHRNG